MDEMLTLVLILALAAGGMLGAVFFGGLWWTVRKGVLAKQPVFWFMGSLLLRMSIVLVGFYLVSGGRWERLSACLLGFICARFIIMRFTEPPVIQGNIQGKEADYAP